VDYVETVRLSDVVDEDVLLMKIDVEGYEHKVDFYQISKK